MKKSILSLVVLALMTSAILTGCSTAAEKVENAEKNVIEADAALNEASDDFLIEVANYRKVADDKFAANEKSIADFNARISEKKKETREDYKGKIAELNQKNSDLKKKMDDYKTFRKESWEKFKLEFNRDMEELMKSFIDFSNSNLK